MNGAKNSYIRRAQAPRRRGGSPANAFVGDTELHVSTAGRAEIDPPMVESSSEARPHIMQPVPNEIVRPNDKPAWEWVRGVARQKMSPSWKHSQIRKAFANLLDAWGAGRGESGIEVHLMVQLPGEEKRRPLVPDVCYFSHERRGTLVGRDADYPPIPPEITVEVKSPDDRDADIEWKQTRYLRWGVKMVIDVDADSPLLKIEGEDSYPDLAIRVRALFQTIISSQERRPGS